MYYLQSEFAIEIYYSSRRNAVSSFNFLSISLALYKNICNVTKHNISFRHFLFISKFISTYFLPTTFISCLPFLFFLLNLHLVLNLTQKIEHRNELASSYFLRKNLSNKGKYIS